MTTRPTDEQRAEWLGRLAAAVTTGREALVDAIFAAGVEAGRAGMTVEWGVRPPAHLTTLVKSWGPNEAEARYRVRQVPFLALVTRRVTDWQAADDA